MDLCEIACRVDRFQPIGIAKSLQTTVRTDQRLQLVDDFFRDQSFQREGCADIAIRRKLR